MTTNFRRGLAFLAVSAGSLISLSAQSQDQPPEGAAPEQQQPSKPEIDFANLDGIKSFRGLAFGSEFDKATDLQLEQDRGQLKIYKRKGEKLSLGPMLLETILYYYFDGKLYGIAFHTNDGQDTIMLNNIFSTAFGPGEPSADGGPSTIWIGKTNGALYEANNATGDGNAFLFDIKLHDAYLKYEDGGVKKAVEQLVKGE